MARPRRQTYTMAQYTENVNEGYISNNFKTQRVPKWKPIVDGLAVTILNDDYISPIILAEEESGQKQIVDGGSRTAAFMMIRYGNYKIKSSVENPIIKYKKMSKDSNGKPIWEDAEFDIRNKTYAQFPKELQKAFNEYQVETVIHECDSETMAMYLRRYNVHTGMNANEKMFIHLPRFADKVRNIINRQFFINHSSYTDAEKEKGMMERVVSESVMCMFHLEKWNKNGKTMATYLNNNASDEEFEKLNNNIERLENIITDDIKDIFNSKDSFVWLTLFNKFTELGIEDSKFAEFLMEFKASLRHNAVDGKLFDTVDSTGSTKDKAIIIAKLHILETLMFEYLDINKEDLEEVDVLSFIKENVNANATQEDIELYEMMLEDCVRIDNPIYNPKNIPSLLAIIAYGMKKNMDKEVCSWLTEYAKNTTTYITLQKQNYLHMMSALQKGATV